MKKNAISQEMAAIRAAVEAENQDKDKVTRLVQAFNGADYPYIISIVTDPSTGRLEIIPMER